MRSAAQAVEAQLRQAAADLHAAARADQGQAHLMTAFQGAVDATFAALGIDAVFTPVGGVPVPVRVIARRPDTIRDDGLIEGADPPSPRSPGGSPRARRRRRWPAT